MSLEIVSNNQKVERRNIYIQLIKGILSYEEHPSLWVHLEQYEQEIKYFFTENLNSDLVIDRHWKFAFLKSANIEVENQHIDEKLFITPMTLINKKHFRFKTSAVLFIIREKYEHILNEQNKIFNFIITKDEIYNRWMAIMPKANNEIELKKNIQVSINDLVLIGVIKRQKEDSDLYTIHPIIQHIMNIQTMNEFLNKIIKYNKGEEQTTSIEEMKLEMAVEEETLVTFNDENLE